MSSYVQQNGVHEQEKRECQESVLLTTTLYPMDIPPDTLPPVRDNFPKPTKKQQPKSYSSKIALKRDKLCDTASLENKHTVTDSILSEDKNAKVISPFCFDKDSAVESNSKSYRAVHGLRYLQNYKSMLKQRGVRYQEIFGHTPRKPEERTGLVKIPTLNRESSKEKQSLNSALSEPYPEQLKRSYDRKLPDIYPRDSDHILKDEENGHDIALRSTETSVAHFTRRDTDEESLDRHNHVTTSGRGGDDVFDALGRTLNDNLNDVIWKDSLNTVPMSHKRSPRRKGKLGDIITPQHMEKLLESNEALLKFEEGIGYPYEK